MSKVHTDDIQERFIEEVYRSSGHQHFHRLLYKVKITSLLLFLSLSTEYRGFYLRFDLFVRGGATHHFPLPLEGRKDYFLS